MPYIKEERRKTVDECIEQMVGSLLLNVFRDSYDEKPTPENLSSEELLSIIGDINYCISRVVSKLMGKPAYSKIAMITGVLENVKQEYYRRVGVILEDQKILENGDIREYGKLQ